MRALLLLLVACGETVPDDRAALDLYPEYKSWTPTFVRGDAPGHTGFRIIYANPIARDPAQTLELGYQEGAVLIKEVYNDEAMTDLRHIAVMQRFGPVTRAGEDDGGWYFTEAPAGGEEKHFDFCFRRCHAAAPYNGAWLDYRD